MLTVWGENLNGDAPLSEYPRPQMRRESYKNLNGRWEYAIRSDSKLPESYDGEIIVPFSPESELSGVNRTLKPNETLFYRRKIVFEEGFLSDCTLLHFGAVDQSATVYFNGKNLGTYLSCYLPFSVDISEHIQAENELIVAVTDLSDSSYHSRGKQRSKRGGIWYGCQSGIWQTVWVESLPKRHIDSLDICPNFDEGSVSITVKSSDYAPCSIDFEGKTFEGLTNETITLPVPDFIAWSPENPRLYPFYARLGFDLVESYFAMRKFGVSEDEKGVPRLFLNNEPYFHHGLLDQGYYSDGLYTPPSDEAMMFDIELAKKLGFNMLRKHIKIEPLRWYYHCDRIGMLVWQDMMNGGGSYNPIIISAPLVTNIHLRDNHYRLFARKEEASRRDYTEALKRMVELLKNVPSIAMWVPFNEGWGQFDAAEAVKAILSIDKSRTIDHASGWHDQGISDVKSLHVYFKKYRFKPDKKGRAVVLSEFGGYNLRIHGHCFNQKDFGYKRFSSKEEFEKALDALYKNEIAPAIKQGLAATVYTQLSDVEDELNGLVTYDRREVKITNPINV
ncbi:MAG: glycoside hydrolase family 2 TIM barrel-domain containing protein [Clostridia bacterium]|nr:glycoside hydrolase family 2 TIM barrel-domain containing protein [Clostridia bacterium]